MGRQKTKENLNRQQVVHEVPINQAIAMYQEGLAEISTGEIKLTPAGLKKLGVSALGVRLVIQGTKRAPPAPCGSGLSPPKPD